MISLGCLVGYYAALLDVWHASGSPDFWAGEAIAWFEWRWLAVLYWPMLLFHAAFLGAGLWLVIRARGGAAAGDGTAEIRTALERFTRLVATKDPAILAEFTSDDDTFLLGSEAGESAAGRGELEAFFTRLFRRDVTFSWEWDRVDVSGAGDTAWLVADGTVVVSSAAGTQRSPYRITGVLQRHGGRWLWRQYHGSEPAGPG